mgnify:CR=1 FL=1|tara:strand:+ start:530 stop:1837 length:1308 start_codon:yes stop_codon:yes gene_type:complete
MSYRKFGKGDILINTLRTHPRVDFLIYSGTTFYNGIPHEPGEFRLQHNNVYMTPEGYENLYEYNIDRTAVGIEGDTTTGSNPLIYPYIPKDGSRTQLFMTGAFSKAEYDSAVYGDLFTGSYPQYAAIKRELILTPSGSCDDRSKDDCAHNFSFFSLKNMLNHYSVLSPHYAVSSAYGDGWDKNSQEINLIHIPSIFYGSKIRPGSVRLRFYLTGALIGELRDEKENGELIQTLPTGSANSGSVAGVVLYSEGFALLTGSWELNSTQLQLISGSHVSPKWLYWGAGCRDGVTEDLHTSGEPAEGKDMPLGHGTGSLLSASFTMDFEGTTKTQVLTMYTRAPRGKVNYSNNPTYVKHGQRLINYTSSQVYEENPKREIKNTVSSSFSNFVENYKRQVYISKVAVYDEHKNLIGIATLANPVLKKENEDLSIKLKLDI